MSVFRELDHSSFLGGGLDGLAYITNMSDVQASICPPPCECIDCQHSFYAAEEQHRPKFSYSNKISNSDARRVIMGHVQNTQEDREYVLQRLSSHGDTIVNRWKKKSREKRQALLNDACPDLQEVRWFFPRYTFTPESKMASSRNLASRRHLLLPWLSVEVLKMNPVVLFALLHYRTAYPPQDWATYDSRQLILSWSCGYFELEFSSKCVIMHGQRYGELVDWQAGPAHRADILGFPRARLVLEAQAYLMGTLRKIVDKILEGVELNKAAASGKWKSLVNLGFRHSSEVELWSPYTNQAFSAPPLLRVDNLVSTAYTRLNELGDHLWLLQTEVDYMRHYIKVLRQGEYYKVMDANGAGESVTQQIWMDILGYWWWSWVKDECEHVKGVLDRFRDNVHPGSPLPLRYDKALGGLELLLVNRVNSQTQHLEAELPGRPGFSRKWTFERDSTTNSSTLIKLHRKGTTKQKETFDEDPLEWCLVQMQGAPDTQTNFDHAGLFTFLENHLAVSSSKERARIDEVLYRKLSDLAAYHEMLLAIRLHRPQNAFRDMDEVVQSEDRIAWRIIDTNFLICQRDKEVLGKALFKDFYGASSSLPGVSKNTARLKHFQTLHEALEEFWAGLRNSCRKTLDESGFKPEEVSAALGIISANLSSEYISKVQAEEQQILAAIENARVRPTAPLQNQWGSNIEQPSASLSKQKSKTRPAGQAELLEVENSIASVALDSSQESALTITVTKRAFDMITLMFPSTAEEAAKSLEWDTFVHAMSDMGFTGRNGGGSAVVFENSSLVESGNDSGRIVFHKPHPVSKIDSIKLHSWGKRMAKWFDWRRELFVLEA
jgi:hypothetical protein